MTVLGKRRRDITDDVFLAAVSEVRAADPNGGLAAIGRRLGINPSAVRSRLKTLGVPRQPGMCVAATSTLYARDGSISAQWVKESAKTADPDEWARIVKEAFADTQPVKTIPKPRCDKSELLAVYPIGDHHLACYSWGEETGGGDYDIKIAERLLVSAARHLVEQAPASKRALIVDVGDFFHVDNIRNETSRNGNSLDVDTRYAAMIKAGVSMLRAVIESALGKHEQVEVVCSPGNHNDLGALWLSLALGCLYERNPRVKIHQTPGKFHYIRHGRCLIGVTHGDTVKPDALPGVMAVDRSKDWGETDHRYWITGHIHQRKVLEFPGVMVESFRTLAARDAWASAAGYRSGRDMTSLVLHAQHGEVQRSRFDVGMLA